MVRIRSLVFVLALLAIGPVSAQGTQLQGWANFLEAIGDTNISNADALQGREFVLEVAGASGETTLELTPAEAFNVQRVSSNRFKVKIINPRLLITDDPIPEFTKITYRIVDTAVGEGIFGAAIEGRATCSYQVTYKRTGGDQLDLEQLRTSYDVEATLTNPSIAEVRPEGRGFAVIRRPDQGGNVDLNVTLRRKSDGRTLAADPVRIPNCQTSAPSTTLVAADPAPNQCLSTNLDIGVICEDCAPLRVSIKAEYTNSCAKAVRCDLTYNLLYGNEVRAQLSDYVQVSANQVYRPSAFELSTIPSRRIFRVTGPDLRNCRYPT